MNESAERKWRFLIRNIDTLFYILKFVGLLITAASGIVGFLGKRPWEDYVVKPAIVAPGHVAAQKRRITKWGWCSLGLIIFGSFVAIGAQIAETVRIKQKQSLERQEREAEQKAHQREITRIQRENQEEMAKRLQAQSLSLAEMFFQGRELDSQRAAFLEKAKLAGLDVRIPEYSNSVSMPNLTAEIRKALKSIPDELRAASVARYQAGRTHLNPQ